MDFLLMALLFFSVYFMGLFVGHKVLKHKDPKLPRLPVMVDYDALSGQVKITYPGDIICTTAPVLPHSVARPGHIHYGTLTLALPVVDEVEDVVSDEEFEAYREKLLK